jgi:hypothetical protein
MLKQCLENVCEGLLHACFSGRKQNISNPESWKQFKSVLFDVSNKILVMNWMKDFSQEISQDYFSQKWMKSMDIIGTCISDEIWELLL